MELTTYADAQEYAARVLPLLQADEARHNLAIGVVSALRAGRLRPDAAPLLAVVSDASGTAAAVMHTPPYGLLLTGLPSGAERAVVGAVLAGGWRPPLVVGPPEAVDATVTEWCARTGATVDAVRRQGVYALTSLVPERATPGQARSATERDVDLVTDWFTAFNTELGLRPALRREHIAERVMAGDILLWEVGAAAVSMAGIAGRTLRGARIGPVYTPPERRGRGYAAAVTAEATRRCLEAGAEQCFLYTDLDNSTANGVYRRLGYRMVCESREVTFA